VRDVVRSTSAAPTYFTPAKIKNLASNEPMVNVDGGVFANNPAMCAYAECRDTEFVDVGSPEAKDMLLLSIGTGGGQFDLPNLGKSGDWSVLNWAKSIPEIMMDGSIDTVDYQMKHLFGSLAVEYRKNYKRIDVPLENRTYSSNMADASPKNIEALKQAGKATLDAALKLNDDELGLDAFIELLVG
jgi:patatin-like phospholipase/acyl hydrolase